MAQENNDKIRLGISSCLLGNQVRYNGGHQRDPYLTDTLSRFFDFVPVCPEVECGLPVPREAMRLVGDPEAPRLVTVTSRIDLSEQMNRWARRRVRELEDEEICGFIFKSKSPSSGMERVKVYDHNNVPRAVGVGLFARIFKEHFPLLPTEEEGRLHDMGLRENFIESVFVYRRWRALLAAPSPGKLVAFHSEHKMLLRAHSEKLYRQLGKIVAEAGSQDLPTLLERYQAPLMAAMRLKPTVKKHLNVLLHIVGHFKKLLSSDEKKELLELIERYGEQHLPLIVPITLINHYVRKYKEPYLQRQYYLHPHPLELKLRNHA
ncbi:YbgA family protein [Desulfogranum mediterraneum]|uniref:YbgA family protein n=1 Tax=Desulfogranum mediterraneum TaxID=160661 RepID=UPI0004168578|nr:DUF523 and DUF1722 domain-containing protein [Desulfogranum mediterraneum]